MITSKSPRKVLKLAYALGVEVLPKYFSPFSRHAFTKPQLFACLVLREHQKKSFRGIEALLAFYEEDRAEGCLIDEDGDMLLFQWGTMARW